MEARRTVESSREDGPRTLKWMFTRLRRCIRVGSERVDGSLVRGALCWGGESDLPI